MWWAQQGSNLWPSACKADALPAELTLHYVNESIDTIFKMVTRTGFKPVNARVKGVCVKSLHQRAMAATVRIELTTNRLTAGCSTAELCGHAFNRLKHNKKYNKKNKNFTNKKFFLNLFCFFTNF